MGVLDLGCEAECVDELEGVGEGLLLISGNVTQSLVNRLGANWAGAVLRSCVRV